MVNPEAISHLKQILAEIILPNGIAKTDNFLGLREVDSKIREAKLIFQSLNDLPNGFVEGMSGDIDFSAQSRRVRLEALAGYIRNALKFIESGSASKSKNVINPAPDTTKLTVTLPTLKSSIDRRWLEAQKCVQVECFTSAVIMMGSILEGLLLARSNLSPQIAYQSSKAPKDKIGKIPAIHDWSLSSLIDVAVDVGWIKSDRGKFSHALRESRNVVHPWVEVTTRANFDEATCKTSWEVLKASVDDLLKSVN